MKAYRGRIAPSPTGYLHLGHAKTFWSAFNRCRLANGTLIYRDEDIDRLRCKEVFSKAAVQDIQQLGIVWQEGPILQSTRIPLYVSALEALAARGWIYPCEWSRKEINQHEETRFTPKGEPIFPLALRSNSGIHESSLNLETNWRFKVPKEDHLVFSDKNLGKQAFMGQEDFGDFLVWRKEGMAAYELAVVVDDAEMGITEVVRGEDLLVSTARQLLLYQALGEEPPDFFHETLVVDESGDRLAKRNDSLALRTLFEEGHSLESIQQMWESRS